MCAHHVSSQYGPESAEWQVLLCRRCSEPSRAVTIAWVVAPQVLAGLPALRCFELSESQYTGEDLAALSALTALTRLGLSRVEALPLPEALAALAGSLRALEIHSAVAVNQHAILDAYSEALTGLESLALDFGATPTITRLWLPPATAQLPRLHSLALSSYAARNTHVTPGGWPGALPACISTLRWLALPLELALPSLAALADAQHLQTLCVLLPPKAASFDAGQWSALWEFVATHPPLRCFVYETPIRPPACAYNFFDALLLLQQRRPALRVQRLLSPGNRFRNPPSCWAELAA